MANQDWNADYRLVASAIEYLTANRIDQPTLTQVAEHVGVSLWHLQRTFSRWAGVSPKRFLQYLTIGHAKALLDESRSVLDAAQAAGLSGPGRLHDLFVTAEGLTPGEYKTQGAGLAIAYGRHATPFGDCLLAVTERGVCWLSFLDDEERENTSDRTFMNARLALKESWPAATFIEDADKTAPFASRIFDLAKNEKDAPLPLLLKGTNFQLKVWEALLAIPPGAVATYGSIAEMVGSPFASRAVGGAVGSNRIAYLIPCHRVIRSSGAVNNYRWGAVRKQAMLGWEAAQTERALADAYQHD